MPPRFGWGDADMWIPAKPSKAVTNSAYAGAFPQFWFLIGHMKPGVYMKESESDLTVVAQRLATVYPKDYPKHFTVQIESLTNLVVGRFRTTLFIVLAAVGLLLLIGCGNVANLLLARATTREKEFAIRSALGASRSRLIRQLLVESLILATGGAAVGALLAWGGLKFLVALMPQEIIPAEAVIRMNTPVLAFTLGVAVPTARYKTASQVTGFYRPLLQRLKALPGVVEATETSTLPPYGGIPSDIEIPGKTHAEKWTAMFQLCSEGYFGVLKIQFLDGRAFTEAEVNGARKLAIVNQMFVKKYLGNENPIGRQVRIAQLAEFDDAVKEPVFEIIGLVADAKNRGLQDPPEPELWVPYTVTGSAFRGILVRTAKEPLTMVNAVEHEIWATDSNVILHSQETLYGQI